MMDDVARDIGRFIQIAFWLIPTLAFLVLLLIMVIVVLVAR